MSHITFVMRAPTMPGQHNINAWLDPVNHISETNESNNAPCCLKLFT
jgi:subtilase family serine protease